MTWMRSLQDDVVVSVVLTQSSVWDMNCPKERNSGVPRNVRLSAPKRLYTTGRKPPDFCRVREWRRLGSDGQEPPFREQRGRVRDVDRRVDCPAGSWICWTLL